MAELGYDTFLLNNDGSLPRLVPPATRVTSRFFINMLFSTIEHVAALWPIEKFDARARPPDP